MYLISETHNNVRGFYKGQKTTQGNLCLREHWQLEPTYGNVIPINHLRELSGAHFYPLYYGRRLRVVGITSGGTLTGRV